MSAALAYCTVRLLGVFGAFGAFGGFGAFAGLDVTHIALAIVCRKYSTLRAKAITPARMMLVDMSISCDPTRVVAILVSAEITQELGLACVSVKMSSRSVFCWW